MIEYLHMTTPLPVFFKYLANLYACFSAPPISNPDNTIKYLFNSHKFPFTMKFYFTYLITFFLLCIYHSTHSFHCGSGFMCKQITYFITNHGILAKCYYPIQLILSPK